MLETKQIVVQFGILDWEQCHTRFDQRPASDAADDPKFPARAIWYLTQRLYTFHYAQVWDSQSQIRLCDQVWDGQGNDPHLERFATNERSFSMGDIVILSNETVWLATRDGWQCLNPGVI